MNIQVRKARTQDIPSVASLINEMARHNLLLPVQMDQITVFIRDFFVAFEKDVFLGCCALHIYTKKLAEIRSLAVVPTARHQGVGKALALKCIEESQRLGLNRLFALTRTQPFFQSLGFNETSKEALPEKVYKDCVSCLKIDSCDEKAMIRDL